MSNYLSDACVCPPLYELVEEKADENEVGGACYIFEDLLPFSWAVSCPSRCSNQQGQGCNSYHREPLQMLLLCFALCPSSLSTQSLLQPRALGPFLCLQICDSSLCIDRCMQNRKQGEANVEEMATERSLPLRKPSSSSEDYPSCLANFAPVGGRLSSPKVLFFVDL